MREYAALPAEQASHFTKLLERVVQRDPRVEYKKLGGQLARQFQCVEVWEAKASRKDRLFLDGMSVPMTIVGFGHRGQSTLFRRER